MAQNLAPAQISRKSLGLPEGCRLYGCPQSLFKFHPDFDKVFANILERDPTGHIVLIQGKSESLTKLLVERLEARSPEIIERVIFVSRQSRERFLGVISLMDVLLDPIYFGSGNTMYEAISLGIPIITCPGQFMRGRIVAGAYSQMELEDAPIAENIEKYAELAVAFANDIERRKTFKENCLKQAAKLFENKKTVRELEYFFEASLDAYTRDTKLPDGWTPNFSGEIQE